MEILLLIGAIVALAWGGVILVRGGLVAGLLLVLLSGVCFGHAFYRLPAGPLPITSDRVLLLVVIAQYVVYRRWGLTDPKPLSRADVLLGAFFLVLLVSTFTHDFTSQRALPVSQLAFFYLMPAIVYWIARQTAWTEPAAQWLFACLGIFGIYLALTAVAETHGWGGLVFPSYIHSPAFKEFYGRGRGPLLNPAGNGLLQTLGLCGALMLWPRVGRRGQLVLLGLIPLFAYGIYSTYTRSAWIGAAGALGVLVALTTPRGWRMPVIGTALVVSLLVTALSWEQFIAFKRDKELTAEDAAESAKLRPILAQVAWSMFLDRPLLGCGFGQYGEQSRPYLSDRTSELPLEKARPYVQHNVLLALLTETGLLGMGLYMAVLAYWTRTAWRLWRADVAPLWVRQTGLLFIAYLVAYLANGMFQDVSIIPMINMTLFFLAGAVMALTPWLVTSTRRERLELWLPEADAALAAR
jgi:O-antigen ligase